MKKATRRTTTEADKVAAMVARTAPLALAALCVVPAMFVNVDWSPATPLAWKVAPAALILGSALFVEAGYRARSYVLSPLFVAFALLLMMCNVLSAFNNATHRTGDRSDHRRAQIEAAEREKLQRSQWSQSRSEAAKLAGEMPAASIRADIQQIIAADAKRWQATGQCDPMRTTVGASMAFCANVAALQKKLGAAQRRDLLDQQITALNAKSATAAPASADPFGDNLAGFLAAFGFRLSDDAKHALSTQRDLLFSIGLELLATFGPTASLLILFGAKGHQSLPAPVDAARTPAPRLETVKASIVPSNDVPAIPADTFAVFLSARLELAPGASIRAGDAWLLWQSWCADNNCDPGTQKRFGARMKAHFAHDKTNNRPRYLGVRPKRGVPSLKVVSAA